MKYLTLLAIVRNEEPRYIEEWLDHHFRHGVEEVYLLNHVPNNKPIPVRDRVRVQDVPSPRTQELYYQQALQGINSFWCLIIDADEFVVCNRPLVEILPAYEKHDALAIHWLMFGSSGFKQKVFPVHGSYHWRLPYEHEDNRHIKSIVKPAKVKIKPNNPHYFGIDTVDELFQRVERPQTNYCGNLVRLNHYYTRSEDDWAEKMTRGRADGPKVRTWEDFHTINRSCTVHDSDPTHIKQPTFL